MADPKKEPSAAEKKRRARQSVGQTRPSSPQQAPQEISGEAFRARRLGEDLELPSGLWCKARRVGMEALVQGGKIPNSLLPIVMEALEGGDEGRKRAEEKLRSQMSLEHIGQMMAMYDDITIAVVVTPTIRPVPERCVCGAIKSGQATLQAGTDMPKSHEHTWNPVPDAEREHGTGIAYVDWIDFVDKVYLLNFAVGGTRDLERFRQEQSELLDSLSASPDV